jgi:hypothetical protein
MAMELVTNDLPGNAHAMHSAVGPNLVDISDRITDSVMIEVDPVLKIRPMNVTGMVNRLEEIASEKSGKLIVCFG